MHLIVELLKKIFDLLGPWQHKHHYTLGDVGMSINSKNLIYSENVVPVDGHGTILSEMRIQSD